jgi:hypothetical protein
MGRRRCRLHGGRTPVGPESANWRTGLHSKHLPAGLRALAREAANDPALSDTRPDLARVTALLLNPLRAVKVGRQPLTTDDEQALLALTDARLRVLSLQDRIRRQDRRTITLGQLLKFMDFVVESVRSHIADDDVRLAIANDIRRAAKSGMFDHAEEVEAD